MGARLPPPGPTPRRSLTAAARCSAFSTAAIGPIRAILRNASPTVRTLRRHASVRVGRSLRELLRPRPDGLATFILGRQSHAPEANKVGFRSRQCLPACAERSGGVALLRAIYRFFLLVLFLVPFFVLVLVFF